MLLDPVRQEDLDKFALVGALVHVEGISRELLGPVLAPCLMRPER